MSAKKSLFFSLCLIYSVIGVSLPALAQSKSSSDINSGDINSGDKKGIAIGEVAPDFNLPVVGEDDFLTLKDANASGPIVVVILRGYPGYQCPLCSQQVGALANRATALAKLTKRVVLIYPGEGSKLDKHAEQFMSSRTLPEPLTLVRDPDMKAVTDFGVRWKRPRETAYPAVFVIDKNGRVRWSKISDSHAGRATAEEIINELRKL
jgi:peroxiredoxin